MEGRDSRTPRAQAREVEGAERRDAAGIFAADAGISRDDLEFGKEREDAKEKRPRREKREKT